eukprot:CAMPEP_0197046992 /NCGR_PEP_ID=MMETSP1384-20130603/22570_1 /TAXON_ID=29189 /ORGANISM="Ammonia sp." /LENGTH=805 /DNA_ID=CAMNT_0042478849 /DNA_START=30 /DNA_END=2447 /DNA_ORIENTATION=-
MGTFACFFGWLLLISAAAVSNDTESVITSWTQTEVTDFNLLRSKPVYAPVSMSDTKGIWILGGMLEDGTISDSITFLNLETHDTTQYNDFFDPTQNVLPAPIYCKHQCATTINSLDIVIVSPNTLNDDTIYDLWVFHTENVTFTTNISLPTSVSDPCVTSDDEHSVVYIIGGKDESGNVLDVLQIYDVGNQEWQLAASPLNTGRSGASCKLYDDKVYVFGGTTQNNDEDTNTIEYYDTTENEWTEVSANDSALSVATHYHRALSIENHLFNVGGFQSTSYVFDAFVVDTEINPLPAQMPNTSILYAILYVNDDRLFIISGETDAGQISNVLEYSSEMDIAVVGPSAAPTAAPADDDLVDVLEEELNDILNSDLFDPTTWSMFTTVIVAIVSALVFVSCLAFCQHKFHCKICTFCGCHGADDVEWWRLARYSLQVYDLFTDLNFAFTLWQEWQRWSEDGADSTYSADDVEYQTKYHFYAAIIATVFLVVPYIANLLFVLCPCGLPALLSAPSFAEAKLWVIARSKLFAILVLLSGGAYAALTLVNSKMFGISLFTMGLSRRQLLQFTDIQVKLSITLENIPQLALQLSVIINRWLNPQIYNGNLVDMVTGMSLVSTSFLMVIGMVSCCIIKSQVQDDLEITIEATAEDTLNKKVIRRIHKCLGFRASISRELALVFGVDETVIEVPRIARTIYGCKIRLYIGRTESLQSIDSLKRRQKDVHKVLCLLFRVDEQDVNLQFVSTEQDVEALEDMFAGGEINMTGLRQISNYCDPGEDAEEAKRRHLSTIASQSEAPYTPNSPNTPTTN